MLHLLGPTRRPMWLKFFHLLSWPWSLYSSQRLSYRGAFLYRGPSATAHERTLLIVLSPDFGQLHSETEPSTIQASPHSLASERPPYRCCPSSGGQFEKIDWTGRPSNNEWDHTCRSYFPFWCRPPPRSRAATSPNASQSQTLGFKSLTSPRSHTALCGKMLCPPTCGVVATPEAVYNSSVEN